jgi:putative nucleotidyltransferase with HDIG domain
MYLGYDRSHPDDAWCLGVEHPFKIDDITKECTEYFDDDVDTLPTWANLDLRGDAYSPPRLIVLCGLPGSGKSTYAKNKITNDPSTIWLSSDKIRERLYGDAGCQDNPSKVFEIMQKEAVDALNNGFDVIYDATSITRKARAGILDVVPKHVRKYCVVIWAPPEICVERDRFRERSVGKEVIGKMLRRFEAPFYDEGFDTILVHISDVYYNKKQYYLDLIHAMDIPHDNPHHTMSVIEHCHLCGNNLLGEVAPDVVIKAGYLHDIGKPLTKTFKNRKGEESDIAHYYDHQAVGAWMSYGIEGHNPTLAWLISSHMAPFINQKYYNSLPACYKSWLDKLHSADKAAH